MVWYHLHRSSCMHPFTEFCFGFFVSVTCPLISYFFITLWNSVFLQFFLCTILNHLVRWSIFLDELILSYVVIIFFLIKYASTKNCLLPNTWQYVSSCIDCHLESMVLVDIVPCILRTPNILSDLYLRASGIISDLFIFCVVALRLSDPWINLVPISC